MTSFVVKRPVASELELVHNHQSLIKSIYNLQFQKVGRRLVLELLEINAFLTTSQGRRELAKCPVSVPLFPFMAIPIQAVSALQVINAALSSKVRDQCKKGKLLIHQHP